MDKFIEMAEKEGVSKEAILGMLQRDLLERERTSNIMYWIKFRQIVSLVLMGLTLLCLIAILAEINTNLFYIKDIIETLK